MTVHALTPEQDQTTAAQVDKKIARERSKSVRVFDELWADYLEAQASRGDPAASRKPGPSHRCCQRNSVADDRHAVADVYPTAFKFGVMRTMLEDGFPDGGALAMLESIRDDAARLVRP